jgi:hypothetical protein
MSSLSYMLMVTLLTDFIGFELKKLEDSSSLLKFSSRSTSNLISKPTDFAKFLALWVPLCVIVNYQSRGSDWYADTWVSISEFSRSWLKQPAA